MLSVNALIFKHNLPLAINKSDPNTQLIIIPIRARLICRREAVASQTRSAACEKSSAAP